MPILTKLKTLIGGSNERTISYTCSKCETRFSLPERDPVECPECDADPEFAVPESGITLVGYRCSECDFDFSLPEDVPIVCPECDATSARAVSGVR